jgi:hypothetical protein
VSARQTLALSWPGGLLDIKVWAYHQHETASFLRIFWLTIRLFYYFLLAVGDVYREMIRLMSLKESGKKRLLRVRLDRWTSSRISNE